MSSHIPTSIDGKTSRRAYFSGTKGEIAHYFPVGNVALFDLHRYAIASFLGISASNWTVALNNWNTTRDSEDAGRREDTAERSRMSQTPIRPDKRENVDLYMMALDTVNL